MPTSDQYTFDPGIDYSLLFGGFATALTQGVQLATPNSAHGIVAYNETQPLTTGQPSGYPADWYAFNKRGLWITPSTGRTCAFKTGVGFVNVANLIDPGVITGTMVADGTLTLSKLTPGGGATAGQAVLVNGAATGFELGDAVTNRPNDSIPVAKLTHSGGSGTQFVTTSGGVTVWAQLTGTILNAIYASGPDFDVTNLGTGAAGDVLATSDDGTTVVWKGRSTIFANNTIPVANLAVGTGNALKTIQVNAAGTLFEIVPFPTAAVTTGAAIYAYTAPNGTAAATVAASPATVPINAAVTGASWGTLGGSAVTITAGTYMIRGSVNICDIGGGSPNPLGRVKLLNSATILNWVDFNVNNTDERTQVTVEAVLTVASTAVISLVIEYTGTAVYNVWTGGTDVEHIASLSFIKLS